MGAVGEGAAALRIAALVSLPHLPAPLLLATTVRRRRDACAKTRRLRRCQRLGSADHSEALCGCSLSHQESRPRRSGERRGGPADCRHLLPLACARPRPQAPVPAQKLRLRARRLLQPVEAGVELRGEARERAGE